MLKIYRGWGPMYGMGEPVQINNRVHMPVEDEETGDMLSEEDQRLKELQKEEEERRKEAERKIEMERRINEEAEAKLKQFLVRRNDALEKERTEIIENAKREANAITADAKVTTMTVIKKAESESLKLREEARREGHDQGYAEGREESLEKYKKYIDAAGKLLTEINSRKEAYYISGEEEMRETVFELVQKIIGVEIKTNPQIIDGIIAEAAKNFRNSDYIKITLADDGISERYVTDRKLMRDIVPYIPEIEIEFDDEAEEGTVIIDDGSEIIDAGIPTQLDFLKEILRNTRGESTEDEAEFMEEIKGRAHRRKSITITADDGADTAGAEAVKAETRAESLKAETAGAETTKAGTAGAETMKAETAGAETTKAGTAGAETMKAETAVESGMVEAGMSVAESMIEMPEPVVEPISEPEVEATEVEMAAEAEIAAEIQPEVREPEPVVEEAKPAAKPKAKTSRSRKKAAEPKPEPVAEPVVEAAGPESAAGAEQISESVSAEQELSADMDAALAEAMAYVESAAEELPELEAELASETAPEPFSEAMLNAAADLAEAAASLNAAAVDEPETPAAEEMTLEQLKME